MLIIIAVDGRLRSQDIDLNIVLSNKFLEREREKETNALL